VVDLSAFSHVPRVPVESAADPALLVLGLLSAVLVAVALVGFRRRDVNVS
jgi:ABC-2 type transport system permease protein